MSIASEILKLNTNLTDSYTACNNKGATIPADQNFDNLATCIGTISTGGTIDSLTITPTTSQQTITASGGVDGYSPITVNAVTSAIDNNITSGNIKSGVSILGVSGSVIELNGETRTVSLTSSAGNTFTPSSGKNGITSITVNPSNLAKTVNPSTISQSISVSSGYSGNGTITVNPVTASIDNNIIAGNIKNGVTILGVTGTYTGGSSTKYGATVDCFLGNVNANGVLQAPSLSQKIDLVFTGVKDVGNYILKNKFNLGGDYLGINNISFPDLISLTGITSLEEAFSSGLTESTLIFDMSNLVTVTGSGACKLMCSGRLIETLKLDSLTTVSGSQAFYQAFDSSEITNINLSNLTTVSGAQAFYGAFEHSGYSGSSITFNSLSTISGANAFQNAFSGYDPLILSFPALTSSSFGSYTNQFNNMLEDREDSVVHFPSNLQSVIGSWVDVTRGFGGYNTTILFDLPATT